MTSKANIINRLRASQQPFTQIAPIQARMPVSPPLAPSALQTQFIEQAQLIGIKTIVVKDDQSAIQAILGIIADDTMVLSWHMSEIPVNGLGEALNQHHIKVMPPRSDGVRVGITGADVAIASTASIVVSSRVGRDRAVSLLPYVHIAVLTPSQIVANLETWMEAIKQDVAGFRQVGNHIIITGASRTADIAMELVMGAHGPAELHIIIKE